MKHTFSLPDLGEGLTDAVILEWKVASGDSVTVDQVVVEVETAKASVEVPCPFHGVVGALHGNEGDVVEVGRPLISIDDETSSGNVLIGYGTGPAQTSRRRRVSVQSPEGAPDRVTAPKVLSPVVRDLALAGGLALDDIPTIGDHGVVTRGDVERALSPEPGTTRIPLTGVRKTIADKLSRSRSEIPDATVWVDVDATALLQARRDLDGAADGVAISLLALSAKLVVLALGRFPELNSTVDAREIVRHDDVNLGIAAQTDRGLLVPVVRQANKIGLCDLAQQLAETTDQARAGTLSPTRLTGGTFTLNNYGVFGVDGSAAIINHPEAAILGIGRIIDRPWVVNGASTVRKIGQLTLTFDHRVCDGGVAGGFLRTVADYIENPVLALAAPLPLSGNAQSSRAQPAQ